MDRPKLWCPHVQPYCTRVGRLEASSPCLGCGLPRISKVIFGVRLISPTGGAPIISHQKSFGVSVCVHVRHGQLGGEPRSFQSAAARHRARSGASRPLQPAHLLGLWQPQHDVDARRSACALGPASVRAGRPRAGRVPPIGLLVPGAAHSTRDSGHAALDAARELSHVLLLPPVPPGPMRRASTSNPNPYPDPDPNPNPNPNQAARHSRRLYRRISSRRCRLHSQVRVRFRVRVKARVRVRVSSRRYRLHSQEPQPQTQP